MTLSFAPKRSLDRLSDERLGAKLRLTENRRVLFNPSTYVYVYIYIYFFFLMENVYCNAPFFLILLFLLFETYYGLLARSDQLISSSVATYSSFSFMSFKSPLNEVIIGKDLGMISASSTPPIQRLPASGTGSEGTSSGIVRVWPSRETDGLREQSNQYTITKVRNQYPNRSSATLKLFSEALNNEIIH